jgi:hypothetical protein
VEKGTKGSLIEAEFVAKHFPSEEYSFPLGGFESTKTITGTFDLAD